MLLFYAEENHSEKEQKASPHDSTVCVSVRVCLSVFGKWLQTL